MSVPALLLALRAAGAEPAGDASVPPGARPEKVWGAGSFTQGPACGPDRSYGAP
jgi:hypothetical protein